jgi:hypothetical protein
VVAAGPGNWQEKVDVLFSKKMEADIRPQSPFDRPRDLQPWLWVAGALAAGICIVIVQLL